jgi:hypothetical protein
MCLHSGLVIDQARKDGFRFRNVDEASHPSANANRSSEEDPRANNSVPEVPEKEKFEDPEKDRVQALGLDG